jgi:hypothetical protein
MAKGKNHAPRAHCCFAHSGEYEAFKEKYRMDTMATVLGNLNRTHASWVMDYKFDNHKHILEDPKAVMGAFISQSCEAATHMAKGNTLEAITGLCNAALLYTFMDQHSDEGMEKVVDEALQEAEDHLRPRKDH